MLRRATPEDVPGMQAAERAAGELFRPLGMALVADDDPPAADLLLAWAAAGRAWVVDDEDGGGGGLAPRGGVAGYLLADVVDGCAHVEQVTVHPRSAGRRHGSALLDHLERWTAARDLPALTLTTFCAVPWNGPCYRRLGFRWLASADVTPGLRALRHAERAQGLDRWPRGCMRRDVRPAAPSPGRPPT